MALWRVLDLITPEGVNLISDWYDSQEPQVQAQFDATLMFLSACDDWEFPEIEEFKRLQRRHVGLGEIRFHISVPGTQGRSKRRRFRPVGIWPPLLDHEFIIILGCEKRRDLQPDKVFDMALRLRKDFVEDQKGTTREHVL